MGIGKRQLPPLPHLGYYVVCGLSFMMAVWTLHFRSHFVGSWVIKRFPALQPPKMDLPVTYENGEPMNAKYAASPVSRWLHMAPAGLWCVLAAVQLSRKRLHRYTGRAFMLCSLLMCIGIEEMCRKKLFFAPPEPLDIFLVRLINLYFLSSGLMCLISAMKGAFGAHRAWAARHLAVGFAVAVQRLFVIAHYILDMRNWDANESVRLHWFSFHFYFTQVLCMAVVELGLRLEKRGRGRGEASAATPTGKKLL